MTEYKHVVYPIGSLTGAAKAHADRLLDLSFQETKEALAARNKAMAESLKQSLPVISMEVLHPGWNKTRGGFR